MKKVFIFTLLALLGLFQAAAQDDNYLPLVREGVQWVNEKVIINHGDTTSYFYKYEIFGEDTRHWNSLDRFNHACYYYTGEKLDVELDSLISGLSEEIQHDNSLEFSEVTSSYNNAYAKMLEEQRLFVPLMSYAISGNKILYWYGGDTDNNFTLNYYFICTDYYVDYLSEIGQDITDIDLLTAENFTMIDPIEIEGVECTRCAYVNEQGDTMCYVVEGIGFDSKCMGDLLTPFTRMPDPNADYQEYCGLSHVVKDGKIIYKGMRYREDQYTGIGEVAADQRHPQDGNYYDLMGRAVGKDVPTMPGIYIHNGKKIVVR